MSNAELLARITINPKVVVGKPIIKGTRLTVQFIIGLLAHGATFAEILDEYKGLTAEDIQACQLFAAQTLDKSDPVHYERPTEPVAHEDWEALT